MILGIVYFTYTIFLLTKLIELSPGEKYILGECIITSTLVMPHIVCVAIAAMFSIMAVK